MIYLDNAATTKIDPRVVDSMMPYLREEYGNPSSKYYKLANDAESAVEESRNYVADLINCTNDQVIFTSGATESNNFIIKGIAEKYKDKGNHIITTKVEHKSIMETCKYLETKGYNITYLDINQFGQVDENELEKSITDQTILISIIWGNNELGTTNDIEKLSKISKKNNIFFHTDATQVLGKINIDIKKYSVDFMSCTAHKIHGPKGIGAAIIGLDSLGFIHEITPLLHGGEQEFDLRAGTLSVHNIVGFGEAANLAKKEMSEHLPRIISLEQKLKKKLKKIVPDIKYNGDQQNKIPGIINMTIPGLNNDFFIQDHNNQLAVSAGSACSITKPSHVLKALGLSSPEISSTLRVSISKFNCQTDIESFVEILTSYI